MKVKYLLSTVAMTVLAGTAYAGLNQPAVVTVDLVNMFASGDQLTARTADNDVEFIGCGIRIFDDGGNAFTFGFCQAGDSAEAEITCFTQNPELLAAMRSTSAYSFISFSWQDDGGGGAECTRIGFSTQSFYLPDPNIKPKGKGK
jgi:hypothetical protein